MKQLVVLLILGSILGSCGCGSPPDETPHVSKSNDSAPPNEGSGGVSTQVRKIGEVKKN